MLCVSVNTQIILNVFVHMNKLYLYNYVDQARCCAYFGQGYGPIVMRHLSCTSNTASLFSCSYIGNDNGCTHNEDAGVKCYGELLLLLFKK